MNADKIFQYLQTKQNVLLTGAPGTGKSRLMNEVAFQFEHPVTTVSNLHTNPDNIPQIRVNSQTVPIPALAQNDNGQNIVPMLKRKNRKVFRATLHQNSKYRDFMTGIVPVLDGTNGYEIYEGILYRANEFAKQPDSSALLIIDELNRGPAIEVFGNAIVALETDKRLDSNNQISAHTQLFELVTKNGTVDYALSPHLYILAAVNQADVSVAPLDVAFLRRWQSVFLHPDYEPLYNKFLVNKYAPIPESATSVEDVYHVAIKALEKINKKISIGKGEEYQIGQGAFLSTEPAGTSINDALDFVLDCWNIIFAHINEVFYGDSNIIAYIVNANKYNSPYSLEEVSFAEETRLILIHTDIDRQTIYNLYRAASED